MAEDPRFRRVQPRRERLHLPFSVSPRHGPLLNAVGALVISMVFGLGVAAILTLVFANVGAPA